MGAVSRGQLALIACSLFVVARVGAFALAHPESLYDDAYIYLRYAENVFAGCPLAFNCADGRIEGFTSPAFLALICLFHLLVDDLVVAARFAGGISLAAALVLGALVPLRSRLGLEPTRLAPLAALAVTVVLAMDEHVLLNAVVGMDAPLGAVAVGGIVHCLLGSGQRGLRRAVCASVLVRPECALFFPCLLLLPSARTLRYWLPIAAFAALVVALRWLLFHDVLPNTFWAKSGGKSEHVVLGAKYLASVLVEWPWLCLAPLALLSGARREVGVILLGAGLWFGSFLRSGGDFYAQGRFAVPLLFVLASLASVGLASLATRIARQRAAVPPLVLGAASGLATLWVGLEHDLGEDPRLEKVERFIEVGKFLRTLPPETSIATTAIGAVSYYSGLRIVDLVGLTNRAVGGGGRSLPELGRTGLGHERHNTEWVLAQKPDIIMTLVWQKTPFTPDAVVTTTVYAEHALLDAIRKNREPYVAFVAEVAPEVHWFFLARNDFAERLGRPSGLRGRRPPPSG